MQDLATDFQTFKNKMAEKNDAAIASLSTENDVQYLSDGYDALVQYKTNMVEYGYIDGECHKDRQSHRRNAVLQLPM